MSESLIDNHKVRYDPSFDAFVPVEISMQAQKDRMRYESKQWHKMHDAPPEGYGLDGYPLQRGKKK